MATEITLDSTPQIQIDWSIQRGDTVGLRLAFREQGGPVSPAARAALQASTWTLSFAVAGSVTAHTWDGDTLVLTVPSSITSRLTRPLRGDLQRNTGSGVVTLAQISGSLTGDVSPAGTLPAAETAPRYHELTVDLITRTVDGVVTVVQGGRGLPGADGRDAPRLTSAATQGQSLILGLDDGTTLPPVPLPVPDTAELEGRVTALEGRPEPDLSGYAMGVELTAVDARVTVLESRPEPDLSGYATTASVDAVSARVDGITVPDLSGYATGVELAGVAGRVTALESAPGADLSGYTTDAEHAALDGRVTALEAAPAPDLSSYATDAELSEVSGRVAALETAPALDLSGYTTDVEHTALGTRVTALEARPEPDLSGYATVAAVDAVNTRVDGINVPDLSGYTTDAEHAALDGRVTALEAAPAPDLSSYATKIELSDGLGGKANASTVGGLSTRVGSIDDRVTVLEGSPGATNLGALTDVQISAPAAGQVLGYDGTGWKNQPAPSGGLSSPGLTVTQTGALQTTGKGGASSVVGNARGVDAVDLQPNRQYAYQVASGVKSTVLGGDGNSATQAYAVAVAGNANSATAAWAFAGGGQSNAASGQHSVVAGGLGNKASGAKSVAMGGGSNAASGDHSAVLGGLSNNVETSGSMGAIGGGSENYVSGRLGTVPGGYQNNASGEYSMAYGRLAYAQTSYSRASGYASRANRMGQESHTSVSIGQVGDAQRTHLTASILTSDGTPADLTLDRRAPSAANRISLLSGQAMAFTALILAKSLSLDGAAGDTAAWEIRGLIRAGISYGSVGTTEMIGSPIITLVAATASAGDWSVAVSADNTNKALRLTVTGAAGKTINWLAVITAAELIA